MSSGHKAIRKSWGFGKEERKTGDSERRENGDPVAPRVLPRRARAGELWRCVVTKIFPQRGCLTSEAAEDLARAEGSKPSSSYRSRKVCAVQPVFARQAQAHPMQLALRDR